MDKLIKISFTAFAIFAIIFGFVRIKQNIKISLQTGDSLTNDSSSLDEIKLRVTDTDNDGLSDWQELGIYRTSPYLADTDSDGVSDADEVANNTDPNCPTDRVCGSEGVNDLDGAQASTPGASSANQNPSDSAIDDLLRQQLDNELQNQSATASQDKPTPGQIRDLLKAGGISDEELQSASDEDLLRLFDEISSQL